ncbi:hypothetical protein HK405_002301, partial [Cladochytrium tenue]
KPRPFSTAEALGSQSDVSTAPSAGNGGDPAVDAEALVSTASARKTSLVSDLNRMLAGPPPKIRRPVPVAAPEQAADEEAEAGSQPAEQQQEEPQVEPEVTVSAESLLPSPVEPPRSPGAEVSAAMEVPQQQPEKKKGGLMGMLSNLTKGRPKAPAVSARKGSNKAHEDEVG